LTIAAGTTLQFRRDAFLRLSGPLDLAGKVDQPVVLEAAETRWKGIAVLNSPEISHWKHAVIRNTDYTRRGAWQLSGGVTFYQSDVTISHCRLEDSAAEDALNIIRSRFTIDHSTLAGTRSDAFDSDFSSGHLDSVRFERIGGDAVDLSGTSATASDLSFREVRDKAISLGEESEFEGTSIEIERAEVGIASKDASQAVLTAVTGHELGTALLMAYNKKPEYGRASLSVDRVSFDESARLAMAQKGNSILIDGKEMYAESFDVKALYQDEASRKGGVFPVGDGAQGPFRVIAAFCPGSCPDRVAELIDRAEWSIDLTVYGFTDETVAKALARAQKRNVEVTVIYDTSMYHGYHRNKRSMIDPLRDVGLPA
jgi:hypothetical protein